MLKLGYLIMIMLRYVWFLFLLFHYKMGWILLAVHEGAWVAVPMGLEDGGDSRA